MSGGGGNGSTTTTQTQSLPPWLQGYAENFLNQSQNVANLPYQQYQGQRVADLSPVQTNAIQGLSDLTNGTPSTQAASNMLTQTLNGGFSNPYANQQVSGGGTYQFDPTSGGSNQYVGENPYFQSQLDRGAQDITRNYLNGTSAETTRLFNLGGAFGGSAHQQAIANNQHELGNTLANYENQQRQGQYDRSAQLTESGLNRNLNASQFNANLGNQAFESNAQRGLNAQQFNANLGSGAYENERNRQMGAVSGATGLMGAQGQALLNALQGGGIERNQLQDLLSSQYGDFQDWRNYPAQQLGIFGNSLSSMTGSARNTTTNQGLPPPDRVSQGMGILALANMFGRSGGGGK